MNSQLKKIFEKPIFILLLVNIAIGLFTYKDFGTSCDEPLFYSYGDALGYAYSPKEWVSGHFDLYNSYGASGDDHKNRGPAYLFLARNFVYGLKALGSESTAAWHLVNFLFFQLGIYFLYRFALRWMNSWAAFFTGIFFLTQPLLWGHSFINPKDPPFLTFFLASVCIGFEMVDLVTTDQNNKTKKILLASFFLGIATSIRVLGPLAAVLVFIYFLFKLKSIKDFSAWRSFIFYGLGSLVFLFATWPFLWENPLKNFVNVFLFMSDNPTHLAVLFGDNIYRDNAACDDLLTCVKHTDASAALQPYSSFPGSIVGIGPGKDARSWVKVNLPSILSFIGADDGSFPLLRDYSSNVRRMMQVLQDVEKR